MIILGVDTSNKNGGIALARGDANSFEGLEVVPLKGGTFSAQLIPQIADLLARHRLNKSQIDAIATASGPGSFTGLRVGLAGVKGLAEVLKKPIATVSLLEAMAAFGKKERIVAVLDAGRSEVFVGEYCKGELPEPMGESLMSVEQLVSILQRAGERPEVVTCDKHVAEVLRFRGLPVNDDVQRPSSANIARLGLLKVLRGETVTPEALDANYIRRSDAEIFSKPAGQ
jgi:tRNA threonylcarbamoyladenosine biosynthesis protein TsaB